MNRKHLKRSIRWPQGTALSIGAVIGCGILVLPAVTAERAGPAAIISWAIMSLVTIPICMTIGRLSTAMPDAGGIVAFVRHAFGGVAAIMTSWVLLGSIPIGLPIVALVGANYLGSLIGLSNWAVTGVAAMMLSVSIILNYRGIRLSGWVSLAVVCTIIVILVTAVVGAVPAVRLEAFYPFSPNGWIEVGNAAGLIFFAFVGWEMFANLAEEFENPGRDIPISLILSAVIVSLLYLSIAFVTIGTRSYGSRAELAPLSVLIEIRFGRIGSSLTSILALLISFGAIHANIAGFSRMIYAQAREKDFPKLFSLLHPRFATPTNALYCLALVFTIVLLCNGCFEPNIGVLLAWPSVVFIASYAITMASALKLFPKTDIVWWLAGIAFIVTTGIYLFCGWICLYPVTLAILGWLYNGRKRYGKRSVNPIFPAN